MEPSIGLKRINTSAEYKQNTLQCFDMEANSMNLDQTAQSLIWVHIVCNFDYRGTQADESVEDMICCE